MAYTTQDIIDRARIYVDDNHKVTDGWKQPADWLALAKPEILAVYRKWVRESLVSYNTLDAVVSTPPSQILPGQPLAIIGVAQQNGNSFRLLQPAMSQYGRNPYWESGVASPALTWTASISPFPDVNGNPNYSVTLHPPDTASGYFIRYMRFPDYALLSNFIIAPDGYEDYMALRIARKALASEGASSQAIEKLIMQAETDMKMDSLSNTQGDGPKVRIVRPYNKQRIFSNPVVGWPTNPAFWFYP